MDEEKAPMQCAYCGKTTTRWDMDHPVPQCMWDDQPLPPQMVTVVSCVRCNKYWSLHDGYFRSIMALWAAEGSHPLLKQIVETSIRHFARDKTIMKQFVNTVRMESTYNPLGLYVGQKASFQFDRERVTTIFGKIVRGLYFHIHGHTVPQNYHVTVTCDPRIQSDIDIQAIIRKLNPDVHTFGGSDSVFVGKRAYDPKSPDMNMFYFVIYNSVQAIAWVTPKMPNDPIDPSSPEIVEAKLRQYEAKKKMNAGYVKPSEKKKKRKHR